MFGGLGDYDSKEAQRARRQQQAKLLQEQLDEQRQQKEAAAARQREAERLQQERERRDLQPQHQSPARSGRRQYVQEAPPKWPFNDGGSVVAPSAPPPSAGPGRRRGKGPVIDIDAEWAAWDQQHGRARPVQNQAFVPTPPPPAVSSAPPTSRSVPPVRRAASPPPPERLPSPARPASLPSPRATQRHLLQPGPGQSHSAGSSGRLGEDLRSVAARELRDEVQKLRRSCLDQRLGLRMQAESFRAEALRLRAEPSMAAPRGLPLALGGGSVASSVPAWQRPKGSLPGLPPPLQPQGEMGLHLPLTQAPTDRQLPPLPLPLPMPPGSIGSNVSAVPVQGISQTFGGSTPPPATPPPQQAQPWTALLQDLPPQVGAGDLLGGTLPEASTLIFPDSFSADVGSLPGHPTVVSERSQRRPELQLQPEAVVQTAGPPSSGIPLSSSVSDGGCLAGSPPLASRAAADVAAGSAEDAPSPAAGEGTVASPAEQREVPEQPEPPVPSQAAPQELAQETVVEPPHALQEEAPAESAGGQECRRELSTAGEGPESVGARSASPRATSSEALTHRAGRTDDTIFGSLQYSASTEGLAGLATSSRGSFYAARAAPSSGEEAAPPRQQSEVFFGRVVDLKAALQTSGTMKPGDGDQPAAQEEGQGPQEPPVCPFCQQIVHPGPGENPNEAWERHVAAGCPKEEPPPASTAQEASAKDPTAEAAPEAEPVAEVTPPPSAVSGARPPPPAPKSAPAHHQTQDFLISALVPEVGGQGPSGSVMPPLPPAGGAGDAADS